MRSTKFIVLFFGLLATLNAEVGYITEPIRESEKGRLQIITGRRGDSLVYRAVLIDKEKKGRFDSHIEEFYSDGAVVLNISDVGGIPIIRVQSDKPSLTDVYLVYGANRWKPEKVLVKRGSESDFYQLGGDGLFHSATDKERDELVIKLDRINGDEIMPNKALVPTVMSVTPAADAPVAPATTAAHL